MANQSLGTVENFDSPALSGLNHREAITLTSLSAVLTIDGDVRWGQNNAVLGYVLGQVGGTVNIDGTKIWEIPFESSSGLVPTLSTLGNNPVLGMTSGATGELFRVWSTIPTTPLSSMLVPVVSGTTMPLSGYIKLRSKNGNFIAGETIRLQNDSTIVAKTSGQRSWINMVSPAAVQDTISRLGRYNVNGDWYYLGVTNGQDNQQFQFPVSDTCPAIWVETAPNSNVYESWINAAWAWDIPEWTIDGGMKGSGITTDSRGKFFGMDPINGIITIAKRSANSNMGYKPPAGCRVRIGNIILSSVRNVAGQEDFNWVYTQLNTANSTDGSKHVHICQDVNFNKATCNWQLNNNNTNSFYLEDTSISDYLRITNIQNTCVLKNVAIGNSYRFHNNYSLLIAYTDNFTISNCNIWGTLSATSVTTNFRLNAFYVDVSNNSKIIDSTFGTLGSNIEGTPTNSTSLRIDQTNNLLVSGCKTIGAGGMSFTNSNNAKITNNSYSSTIAPYILSAANFGYCFQTINSTNSVYENLTWVDNLTGFHPKSGFFGFSDNSKNITVKNIGSKINPLYTGFGDSYSPNRFSSIGTQNAAIADIVSDIKFKNVNFTALNSANEVGLATSVGAIQWLDGFNKNVTFENVSILSGGNVLRPRGVNTLVKGYRGNIDLTSTAYSYGSNRYGNHFIDSFTNSTSGALMLYLGNEPSETTSPYISANFESNNINGGWAGDGRLLLSKQGQSIIWEMPYYALGYTGFYNKDVSNYGTGTRPSVSYEFQYDKGNGYNGQWLSLPTTTGNTTLTSINPIDPNIGFKIKFKLTKLDDTSTDLRWVKFDLITNDQAQLIQYPLPKEQFGVINGIISGSRIQIYNETKNTEIFNGIVNNTSYTHEYNNGEDFDIGDVVRVRLTYVNGSNAKLRHEIVNLTTSTGFTLLADQVDDDIYNYLAINGSTVTEFTADYPNIQVDIQDADGLTSISRLYAWWVYNEYSEQGIRNYFGGILAEDAANFKIITSKANLKLDNTSSTGVQFVGEFRLYRDDGSNPLVSQTTGGGSITLYAGKVYPFETGVSGLTTEESSTLNKINNIQIDRINNTATIASVGQQLADALRPI